MINDRVRSKAWRLVAYNQTCRKVSNECGNGIIYTPYIRVDEVNSQIINRIYREIVKQFELITTKEKE